MRQMMTGNERVLLQKKIVSSPIFDCLFNSFQFSELGDLSNRATFILMRYDLCQIGIHVLGLVAKKYDPFVNEHMC